jgi:hypothetical protein
VFGRLIMQRVWQNLIILIIFSYAVVMTIWVWGMSWPSWDRDSVIYQREGIGVAYPRAGAIKGEGGGSYFDTAHPKS